ncbi:MAG TPA: hypothetical protein VG389_21355 [Myxococcota bacterium]|jgi:hypothetical protein|nr:hypothetical protein [Myxococcota bacterium]
MIRTAFGTRLGSAPLAGLRRAGPALFGLSLVLALAFAGGCRPRYAGVEADAFSCANGFDDDGDGYIDCDDLGCSAFCGGPTDGGGGGLDSGAGGGDGGTVGFCGDGVRDPGESCDGKDLGGESCATLGLAGGPLGCSIGECVFDTSSCTGGGGCGDGICNGGETCSTCAADCGTCCGNGICSGTETCSTCPSDCGACCGNGVCGGGETCSSCPGDCGACGPVCGDFSCSGGETCTSCPTDCGSCCGNGVCTGGETCSTCPSDCGSCAPFCGDFTCNGTETCSTCPGDCGTCAGSCLYDWDFGTLSGWTASNTCSTTGWRVDTYRAWSTPDALWYGNPATRNYDCGGVSNSGTATSPYVTLSAGSPTVSFEVWMATEGSATYDLLTLSVIPLGGSATAVWSSGTDLATPGSTGAVWIYDSVSLASWAGMLVQFQWSFSTGDAISNTFEGPYIDDMLIGGSC